MVTNIKDVVVGSTDGFTVGFADDTGELFTLGVRWMTLVEKGFGAPLVTYTITGSVTVTTGLELDVEICCSDVDCACVAFAGWIGLEVGITGVDVEELLLLAPPRGAIAPTAILLLVGTVGTGVVVGCVLVEVETDGVAVVALMLVAPPGSESDGDWAELGITKEPREDVEPGTWTGNELVMGDECSTPGVVDEDMDSRVVVDA